VLRRVARSVAAMMTLAKASKSYVALFRQVLETATGPDADLGAGSSDDRRAQLAELEVCVCARGPLLYTAFAVGRVHTERAGFRK
jgi:hypothetical protein